MKMPLTESTALLCKLFLDSELAIHIGSTHKGRVFVNQACAALFGFTSQAELLNAEDGSRVAEKDRQRILEINDRLYKGETGSAIYEFEGIRKDGSLFPIQTFSQRIIWEGVPAIQRTFIDQTKHKEAEKRLKASEASLAKAQRIGNIGSWDWNIATDELAWSDQIYRIFGLEPKEFGASYPAFLKCIHPSDRQFVEQSVRQTVEDHLPYDIEHRIVLPSGEVRQVHEQGEVEYSPTGQPLRMIGTVQDITARKASENTIRESRGMLSGILSIAEEAIILADDDLRITLFSRGAKHVFGYEQEEAIGMSIECLIPERLHSTHRKHVQTFGGGTEKSLQMGARQELIGLRKNREEFPAAISLSKFPTDNGFLYSIILRDVGIENAARDELLSAKLGAEAANRTKSEFLATMSHEIRTPMNGVLGMADLLARTDLTPQQDDFVQTIRESGRSLLDLLNDILDLSKIEAGRMELEAEHFSFAEFLISTKALWARSAQDEGLEFSIQNNSADTDVFQSDRTRLRQVLNNLIGNAIKFTNDGTIDVCVDSFPRDDGRLDLRFEVRDTGIGVSEEQKEKLFQPFTQADSSTTRQYGGTGLGLTISKNLVELLGGEIGLESVPGKGSTFWFSVPVEQGDAAKVVKNLASTSPTNTEQTEHENALHILIAEDNDINQKVVSWMLAPLNCQFDLVENGLEAVAAVARSEYDLVLMDVQMPEMDGIEVTRQIRSMAGAKGKIPIIAMTANAMKGDREKYLEAGMSDYVPKPIDQRELLSAITRSTGVPMPDIDETAAAAPASDISNQPLSDEAVEEIRDLIGNLDDLLNGTGS